MILFVTFTLATSHGFIHIYAIINGRKPLNSIKSIAPQIDNQKIWSHRTFTGQLKEI